MVDPGEADRFVSMVPCERGPSRVVLITRRVLDQTLRDGIVLLHDLHRGTVPAVPGILKALKQRGYTSSPVSQTRLV